jgi:hypothetical protein
MTEDHTFDIQVRVDVKVQTSDDTCKGVCAANQRNENTRQPSLTGLFESIHWWGHKNTGINDAYTHMVHGIHDLCCAHIKDTSRNLPIAVAAFSWCPYKCIFEHSEEYNGPVRARNKNLSALASETMCSQPILIEILTVLLLSTNTHALSLLTSRHFSMLTYLKCSWDILILLHEILKTS